MFLLGSWQGPHSSEGLTGTGQFTAKMIPHRLLDRSLCSSPHGPLHRLIKCPHKEALSSSRKSDPKPQCLLYPNLRNYPFYHSLSVLFGDPSSGFNNYIFGGRGSVVVLFFASLQVLLSLFPLNFFLCVLA